MKRHRPHRTTGLSKRRAVSLMEILISIMVLSIGIIAIASLFPISILRSVQSSQLTNATILRYNAQSMIEVYSDGKDSSIVHDPDHDFDFQTFRTGTIDEKREQIRNVTEHFGESYIVDPLGYAQSQPGLRMIFGHDGNGSADGALRRFPGLAVCDPSVTATAERNALELVTLPDSWDTDLKSDRLTSATATSVTFAADTTLPDPDAANYRIVLFSADGRRSHTRPVASASGTTVNWRGALPDSFTPARARLQHQQIQYTWFLTVRHSSDDPFGSTLVDVVTVFRRSDQIDAERVYHNGNNLVFTASERIAKLKFPADERPPIKRGGYILDADNGHWYHVDSIIGESQTSLDVKLDRPARRDSGRAIVMRGVIKVYPIKAPPNRLRETIGLSN